MNHLRLLLGYMVVTVLAFGYLASQYAYLYGDPAGYAAAIDVPAVKWICFLLLVTALLLAIFPEKETE